MQAHHKVGEAAGWWEREAARYIANPPFEEWEKQRHAETQGERH